MGLPAGGQVGILENLLVGIMGILCSIIPSFHYSSLSDERKHKIAVKTIQVGIQLKKYYYEF